MKTEQELKADCTPEIIKKMVELAEGFECKIQNNEYIIVRSPNGEDYLNSLYCIFTIFDYQHFPLLIHRAVEGWNKKFLGSFIHINITHRRIESFESDSDKSKFYEIYDYQAENLTHVECAMLDCLIEVLK